MLRSLSLDSLVLCVFMLPHSLARGDEAAEQLVLATYKLANDASTASGLVIGFEAADGETQSVVVTAHHVLDQMAGDACLLVSRSLHDSGMYERKDIRIPIRESGNPLWSKHQHHDLAVLPLPKGINVESIPLDSLATEEQLAEVRVGDAVRLAVFPERSEANGAGFPVLRGGSIASFPLLPVKLHPMFIVDTTAWTGDSGGPVIHLSHRSPSGGPLVIGIVRGMRSVTDMVKDSRFVERRTHYPLGISEVLHATLLRELIDQHRADR